MTKAAALHQWFNQFLNFYPASAVPSDVIFPYGTYELIVDAFDAGEQSITVNLWYYTESEAIPNAKVEEISKTIGTTGTVIVCDGGFVWIKRGQPFSQSVVYEDDLNIKRRYINISLEYLTLN